MVATDKDDKPKNPVTIHKARPYRGIPPDETLNSTKDSASMLAITAGTT